MDITIRPSDETYIRIKAEPDIMYEMSKYFTFDVPGARFSPKFKRKQWDGKIRLISPFRPLLYKGLVHKVYEFAESRGYTLANEISPTPDVTRDEVVKFIDTLRLPADITERSYQIDAVHHALDARRAVIVSPTGSGKSFVIYVLLRYLQKKMPGRQQLVVVPTTSLVEQLYTDFEAYAAQDAWSVEENCARIYSGTEKAFDKPILISTWQSMFRREREFFSNVGVVIGDEAHLFKAKSLISLMENLGGASYRIGTTGTLDDTNLHRLVLEGLFGPVEEIVTTKELIDQKHLADVNISAIVLRYKPEERKSIRKFDYAQECAFLAEHPRRNRFLRKLVLSLKGTTLLLFRLLEHGTLLYTDIVERIEDDRPVFRITGETPVEDRERARETANTVDSIVLASTGVFATGINIPNIANIVFAHPTKSKIKNLQSLGRGLRRSGTKTECRVFDIGDDLTWKSRVNLTYKHLQQRIAYYNQGELPYTIIPIDI